MLNPKRAAILIARRMRAAERKKEVKHSKLIKSMGDSKMVYNYST